MKIPKIRILKSKYLKHSIRIGFWFSTGIFLSLFFVISFAFLIFQKVNDGKVYPGVIVNGVNVGGMKKDNVKEYFSKKNESAKNTTFTFVNDKNIVATVSAQEINFGFNEDLIAIQAFSVGRSDNILTNVYLISKAYLSGVYLPGSYKYSDEKLMEILSEFVKSVDKKPVDAVFKFENGRVTTFKPSEKGSAVDKDGLNSKILQQGSQVLYLRPKNLTIQIPIKTLEPSITTEAVNNFGIKELIGIGTSHFAHSIPSRIYNINLATSKFDGVLIAPDEVFSFDKVLGDVSAYTGYKQAYIIQGGKTILGDGGGVCQVSTTFFRAVLNAGLPIVERHAHSYRVGYYEQDSYPGIDATVYYPSVDLKFKNDTGHHILVQTAIDPDNLQLTFYLYGTRDGRTTSISQPVVTNQTPPPPPSYQDDPTLPKNQIKQIDFEAWGANVFFTREVKKDGKTMISEKFVSDYQPWQAIFLKGTQ
ncbi:MAG TPA: VanW family protein [Patescibacteria group bacterium]|nr:VanW family protein [Patescibacteria group bacterium]